MVRRQKRADYVATVTDLSLGRTEQAFTRLATMGAFFESPEPEQRQQRLADDYLEATRRPGAKVLVVSPTHREGDAVTGAIRAVLRSADKLKLAEHETLSLQRSGLTAAHLAVERELRGLILPAVLRVLLAWEDGHQNLHRLGR